LKLKDRLYRTVVRPTLLYVVEWWPIERSHLRRIKVVEMRMIHWICCHARLDKIKNEVIRWKIRVASLEDRTREARLHWSGHMRGRSMHSPANGCEKLDRTDYRRSRGSRRRVGVKLLDST